MMEVEEVSNSPCLALTYTTPVNWFNAYAVPRPARTSTHATFLGDSDRLLPQFRFDHRMAGSLHDGRCTASGPLSHPAG